MWQRGDRFLQVCVGRAQESFVGVSFGRDVPSSKELVARKISEKVTNWECGVMREAQHSSQHQTLAPALCITSEKQ